MTPYLPPSAFSRGIDPVSILVIILFVALFFGIVFWLSGIAVKEAKDERARIERRRRIGEPTKKNGKNHLISERNSPLS